MATKKYCFVPETYKSISIYNPGSITDLKPIDEVTPDATFKYCIDNIDKIKLFYVSAKDEKCIMDNIDYIKYKTIQAIKSIFKVTELSNYKLSIEGESKIEFTLWYDADGNNFNSEKLVEANKSKTLIAHQYIYNFYKRYERTED